MVTAKKPQPKQRQRIVRRILRSLDKCIEAADEAKRARDELQRLAAAQEARS